MDESEFVGKEPCPSCGSRDNLARYSDGHGYCFGCEYYEKGGEAVEGTKTSKRKGDFIRGTPAALSKRRITEETCRFWKYHVHDGRQVANYYRDGELVAQKLRGRDKKFSVIGEGKRMPLYGQWLWGSAKGKRLVIVEGEIDALTVSQAQGNKWPVVSVPQGAPSAAKAVAREIEWVEQFDEVIIAFDMDEPGQDAAKEVAMLLTPGKARIACLPEKDPNACLVAGNQKGLIQALWEAKTYRPDGLVSVDDLIEEAKKPIKHGLPWCFPSLTALTYGRREGDVYTFGAGTGIGKTDLFTQQIEFDINELGERVGVIYLEQKPLETVKRIAGKAGGRRFHVPDDGWAQAELDTELAKLRGKAVFYDSWGGTDWEVVREKIRYMRHSEGIRLIYLDHLTAMADTANERESLEQLMKELATLANELGLIIHLVSHLSTPEGKPHEEGGRVMVRHFKGSRAIGFWSFFMFGLERDQQAEDPERRKITTFRVLKDRYTGQATGKTFGLSYDEATGRLFECELPKEGESDSPFRERDSGDY